MNALEIIEQIKALPPEEKAEVVRFVHEIEAGLPSDKKAEYLDPTVFESAMRRVFHKHSALLSKLAR